MNFGSRLLFAAACVGVVLLCAGCADRESLPYELACFKHSPDQVWSVAIVDLDDDGYDEVAVQSSSSGVWRITLYNDDLTRGFDQINIPTQGEFVFHSGDTGGNYSVHFVYEKGFDSYYRRYGLDGALQSEFFIAKLDDHNGDGTWNGCLEIVGFDDVNGDGVEDVILCINASYDHLPRCVTARDGRTGEELWTFSIGTCLDNYYIVHADVDGDGVKEIVLPTSACDNGVSVNGYSDGTCYLFVLRNDGSVMWEKVIGGRYSSCASPYVVDIDRDGEMEIVFHKHYHDRDPREKSGLFILNAADGAIERSADLEEVCTPYYSLGDLDNDGLEEVVIKTMQGSVIVYDNELNVQSEHADIGVIFLFGIGDLDHDGRNELIAESTNFETLVMDAGMNVIARHNPGESLHGYCGRVSISRSKDKSFFFLWNKFLYQYFLKPTGAGFFLNIVPVLFGAAALAFLVLVITAFRLSSRLSAEKGVVGILMNAGPEVGVITLDARGRLRRMNEACGRFLDVQRMSRTWPERVSGEPLIEAIYRLFDTLRRSAAVERSEDDIEVAGEDERRRVSVGLHKVVGRGGKCAGYVILLADRVDERRRRLAVDTVKVGQEAVHRIKSKAQGCRLLFERLDEAPASEAERERGRQAVADARGLADEVARLAEGFLKLAKLESATLQQVDLNSLVRRALADFRLSTERGIELREDLDAALGPAALDKEQIESLLINLLENAVKASDGKGTITVKTTLVRTPSERPDGRLLETIVLDVADDGCGIEERHLELVYSPYFTRYKGGAGMGLAIVKRIVENHGGEMAIESAAGRGTTVTVRLPAR